MFEDPRDKHDGSCLFWFLWAVVAGCIWAVVCFEL